MCGSRRAIVLLDNRYSPARALFQPHPVQLRYQYHKNVWLSSRHSTIGQSLQSRKSVVPGFKNIFTTLVEATQLFYRCQHPFRHNCYFILFFARANLGTRAGARRFNVAPAFLSTVRDGLARVRAPRSRAAQLSLDTPENLVSRDGSGNTFSLPYMILSTRGNYTLLEGMRTDPVQAIDPMPYRPHTSSRPTAMPADYSQCRVRKQSNECESEKRLVKSQRSGVAFTERGGS